jgi:predicted enzyme related to lactoylglutathione lyase
MTRPTLFSVVGRPGPNIAGVPELISCRPNLEVSVLGPLVRFLRDVLDFQVDTEEEEMGLALLHRDAVGLAVVRTACPAANETTACYIGLTDVDGFHQQCLERGAKVVAPLTDHPWGLRDFVVETPGGHRVAFGERIA